MYTVEKMKKLMDEYGISYKDISKETGVPISTVQKIFGGIVKKPRQSTLEALSKFFVYYDWQSQNTIPKQGEYSKDQIASIGMVSDKHQCL